MVFEFGNFIETKSMFVNKSSLSKSCGVVCNPSENFMHSVLLK